MTPEQINKIKAAVQMLRESAKQFRVTGTPGHASNCDFHASEIEKVALKHEVQNEFAGKEMIVGAKQDAYDGHWMKREGW